MRSVLGPDVLVTRATVELAVQRLALAAAHGFAQKATVQEWLEEGRLDYRELPIPGKYNYLGNQAHAWYYGQKHLSGKSWTNLKKRLSATGFHMVHDRDRQTIYLYWSV